LEDNLGVDWEDSNGNAKLDPEDNILIDPVDKYGHKTEPEHPQITFSTSLNYDFNGFYTTLMYNQYSQYYVLADNAPVVLKADADGNALEESPRLPGWYTLDFLLGYNFKLGANKMNVSLHVFNLLDNDYYQVGSHYGFLKGPERNVQLSLNIAR
jgi:outer membrane receptor for Fe3+-dicitrate